MAGDIWSGIFSGMSGIGNFIGGLGGAAGGLMNYFQNQSMFQQSRQDAASAVQTRARDMERAGINPLLAAGSPAQAMSAPMQQAPDMSGVGRAASAPLDALAQKLQVEGLAADNRLKNAQAAVAEGTVDTNIDLAKSGLTGRNLENMKRSYDTLLVDSNIDKNRLEQEYVKAQTELSGKQSKWLSQQTANDKASFPQDLQAKMIAVKRARRENEFLTQLQKIAPAEVDAVKKWFDTIGSGVDVIRNGVGTVGDIMDIANPFKKGFAPRGGLK